MNSMDAQTAALGQILSYAAPEDQLASHLKTIAVIAKTVLSSFEAEVHGGEFLPAVWENWDNFAARMNDFAEKSAAVVQHAKEGGREAIMGEIVAALSCKSCHDVYREKK